MPAMPCSTATKTIDHLLRRGTSARMAQLQTKGKIEGGRRFRARKSIIGSPIQGRVEKDVSVAGSRRSQPPSIGGWARMTSFNTIFIDDRDPFAHGSCVVK